MKKKIRTILLALILAFSLAACGGTAAEGEDTAREVVIHAPTWYNNDAESRQL